MSDYEARVQRGAAWLDSVDQGWFKRINLGKFSLVNACDCVLGQLALDIAGVDMGYYAVVERGVKGLGRLSPSLAIDLGFHANEEVYDEDCNNINEWPHLEDEWRDLIDRRQRLGA